MGLALPAYGKLNLTLDVLARRGDGYHEIESVMQAISLHDLVLVERTDCKVFTMTGLPIEGENLILKAARELEGVTGRSLPFTIRLHKRLPVGAGLGGGSSDAAAFLRAAVQLYDLRLSPSELKAIGANIGQDVPFFLRGGTGRASGRGATVDPLPPVPRGWAFVVVCPPLAVSTASVYRAWDGRPSGRRTESLLRPEGSYDPDHFGNDLQETTLEHHPAVAAAMAPVRELLPGLRMTGSGAAFFALAPAARVPAGTLDRIRALGLKAWICRPVPAWA